MTGRYPGKVLSFANILSSDGTAVHRNRRGPSKYEIGKEALVDSLLLSRCDFLLRTESNLSVASLFFNPALGSVNLTELSSAAADTNDWQDSCRAC